MRGHWGQLSSQGEASPLPAHSRALEGTGGLHKAGKMLPVLHGQGGSGRESGPNPTSRAVEPRGLFSSASSELGWPWLFAALPKSTCGWGAR